MGSSCSFWWSFHLRQAQKSPCSCTRNWGHPSICLGSRSLHRGCKGPFHLLPAWTAEWSLESDLSNPMSSHSQQASAVPHPSQYPLWARSHHISSLISPRLTYCWFDTGWSSESGRASLSSRWIWRWIRRLSESECTSGCRCLRWDFPPLVHTCRTQTCASSTRWILSWWSSNRMFSRATSRCTSNTDSSICPSQWQYWRDDCALPQAFGFLGWTDSYDHIDPAEARSHTSRQWVLTGTWSPQTAGSSTQGGPKSARWIHRLDPGLGRRSPVTTGRLLALSIVLYRTGRNLWSCQCYWAYLSAGCWLCRSQAKSRGRIKRSAKCQPSRSRRSEFCSRRPK